MSQQEKRDVTRGVATTTSDADSLAGTTTDDALFFLREHGAVEDFSLDKARMAALRRKVDFIVMPFLFLAFGFNFFDKTLLNYANVMGISTSLRLKGNDFTNASSAFWIAVLIAEIPNSYLLQRLPTGKWLGVCLGGWAISTACTAATTSYGGLLAARIFSGIFESAVPPALVLISSQYYTRSEQIARFFWWYAGTPTAMIFGGLFSWAFQHVPKDAALAGWRIITGLRYICLGGLRRMASSGHAHAGLVLSDAEKVSLLEHIKSNQTGVENRRFVARQLLEAALDLQLWIIWLIQILGGGGGGVITTYSSTLIKSFGYTAEHATLLNMGAGPVALAACFICSYGVRYTANRWAWVIAAAVTTIIGSALMAWLPHTNKAGLLAGIYLVNALLGQSPVLYAWIAANIAGHTKRACATTGVNAAFALGNVIGPQTFRAKDAPGYQPAKVAVVCFQSATILLSVLLMIYYRTVNRKRDGSSPLEDLTDAKAYAGLTDMENKLFRYVW